MKTHDNEMNTMKNYKNHVLIDPLHGVKNTCSQEGDLVSLLLKISRGEFSKDKKDVRMHNLMHIVGEDLRNSNDRNLPIYVLYEILIVLK